MTYLALARKWRPRSFADVVGQRHVVGALQNALDSDRVHHAFLFTGTRGVGKTTIARILAKALNCERGVGGDPCGQCASCVAIDQGRFIDFIEVDAASHTGVDNARELLENAQYTPAAGRYKVYLIDEVHMLSKPAFNALLKTLEEPPAHVKFMLATTDPQKIPVTVLSRCLQFNLKRLPHALITERLAAICGSEGIEADEAALQRIGRAAHGSVRDALSLLDQARAHGGGRLVDERVAQMLGTLDRQQIMALLERLAGHDAVGLMATVKALDELAPDYEEILNSMALSLQRMAVIQLAGRTALGDDEDAAALVPLADGMAPETVQLMYQIAVTGRRDIHLAPDPRVGFEMTLLRMVAFQPDGADDVAGIGSAGHARAAAPAPVQRTMPPATGAAKGGVAAGAGTGMRSPGDAAMAALDDWPGFVGQLVIDGAARELAAHSSLDARLPDGSLQLGVDRRNAHLLSDALKERLVHAIRQRLGVEIKVNFSTREDDRDTAASRRAREADAVGQRVRADIAADENVRQMTALFDAEVVADSIRTVPDGKPGRKK